MKFNKNKVWALGAQILFAIFIIIAFYATGLDHITVDGQGITATLKDLNGNMPGDPGTIYGLGIASVVLVFVAILMPLVSVFYENKTLNMAFGWAMILIDVTVLALSLAAFGLAADDDNKLEKGITNAGYVAGSIVFTIVGAAVGLAGNVISYKGDLKNA